MPSNLPEGTPTPNAPGVVGCPDLCGSPSRHLKELFVFLEGVSPNLPGDTVFCSFMWGACLLIYLKAHPLLIHLEWWAVLIRLGALPAI